MVLYRLDGGILRKAPSSLKNIVNPSEELLRRFGYKPLVVKKLEIPAGKSINRYFTVKTLYSENESEIVGTEVAVKKEKPDYQFLVERRISAKYSVKQEIALNRQRLNKSEEFDAYFNYCENAKMQVKAEICEWENAVAFDDCDNSVTA